MGRKSTPGLIKRGGIWHIDKQIRGKRVCESTGESNLWKAEEYLARRIDEIRQAAIFGVRPTRSFRTAATHYLATNGGKTTIADDALHLKQLDPYIGNLALQKVHMGTLKPFIDARLKSSCRDNSKGVKARTVNFALQVVRRILKLATTEWRDEHGLTWLETAAAITLLPQSDQRDPYPLSWEEQSALFQELPDHLAKMALFKVNTGCRQAEVCGLRWDWEVKVNELDTSVFLIPASLVKNRDERLVVLNRIARSVIDGQRAEHPKFVFTFRGNPVDKINGAAWRKARNRANVPLARVHDLKHTFGRRLRAAGVSFEDRQDLLGHRSGRITTHYSQADLTNLIEAANQVCGENSRKSPALVVLKRTASQVG